MLTITDNDGGAPPSTPVASFSATSSNAGEKSGKQNVTVNLAPTSDITLAYTVGGTATVRWPYPSEGGQR